MSTASTYVSHTTTSVSRSSSPERDSCLTFPRAGAACSQTFSFDNPNLLPKQLHHRRAIISLSRATNLPPVVCAALHSRRALRSFLRLYTEYLWSDIVSDDDEEEEEEGSASENESAHTSPKSSTRLPGAYRALCAAVARNCAYRTALLLSAAGADVLSVGYIGPAISRGTAIHSACARGATNALKVLLTQDHLRTAVTCVDCAGLAPIHVAAACNHPQVLRMLVDHDPAALRVRVHFIGVSSTDRSGRSSANSSATDDDDDRRTSRDDWSPRFGKQELHVYGKEERGKVAKLRTTGRYHFTPLHCAAIAGADDSVRKLMEIAREMEQNGTEATVFHGGRAVYASMPNRFAALAKGRVLKEEEVEKGLVVDEERKFAFEKWQWDALSQREVKRLEKEEDSLILNDVVYRWMTDVVEDVCEGTVDDVTYNYYEMRPFSVAEILEARDSEGFTAFMAAVREGNESTVRLLIELGANVNVRGAMRQTALHVAATNGRTRMMEILLDEFELDIDAQNNVMCTALHSAAQGDDPDHVQVVRALIQRGANINATDFLQHTPLLVAAWGPREDIFKELLTSGADPTIIGDDEESTSSPGHMSALERLVVHNCPGLLTFLIEYADDHNLDLDINRKFSEGQTALHLAVKEGSSEMVRTLLNAGADPDRIDDDARSPAMIAARDGHSEILAMLLEEEFVDVERTDSTGLRAIHMASDNDHTECVKELVKHGANVNIDDFDGMFPIHLAASNGSSETIQVLIDNDAEVDRRHAAHSETALHIAAKGRYQTAVALVNAGADIYARNAEDCAPLHIAAENSEPGIAVRLLDAGCSPDLPGPDGKTALHIAAAREASLETVRLLIGRGANVDATDDNGNTPLHITAAASFSSCGIVLLAAGARMNIRNNKGQVPLLTAASKDNLAVLLQLASRGASKEIRDYQGRTALHLAAVHDSQIVTKYLLAYGANVEALDEAQLTPISLAATAENSEIVRLLAEHAGMTIEDFTDKLVYDGGPESSEKDKEKDGENQDETGDGENEQASSETARPAEANANANENENSSIAQDANGEEPASSVQTGQDVQPEAEPSSEPTSGAEESSPVPSQCTEPSTAIQSESQAANAEAPAPSVEQAQEESVPETPLATDTVRTAGRVASASDSPSTKVADAEIMPREADQDSSSITPAPASSASAADVADVVAKRGDDTGSSANVATVSESPEKDVSSDATASTSTSERKSSSANAATATASAADIGPSEANAGAVEADSVDATDTPSNLPEDSQADVDTPAETSAEVAEPTASESANAEPSADANATPSDTAPPTGGEEGGPEQNAAANAANLATSEGGEGGEEQAPTQGDGEGDGEEDGGAGDEAQGEGGEESATVTSASGSGSGSGSGSDDDSEFTSCSVCRKPLEKGDEVRVLWCKHMLHEECAMEHFGGEKMTKNFDCPRCKKPIYAVLVDADRAAEVRQSVSDSEEY